jgi:diketogulonate reductase-like aldo/keto reductase
MNEVAFGAGGPRWPALGLGTWRIGESRASRRAEVAALRRAVEIGYRVFDTAEMYGEGGAEQVLGQALAESMRAGDVRRDALHVVSKVYPHNAGRAGVRAACDRSRQRLGLDRIDLYLLHWRGSHPLAETVAGFSDLVQAGAIGRFGVSNFDVDDLEELFAVPGGDACACNQVQYALGERGVEWALLPWQRARQVPLMAYCPIDQGRSARDAVLARIGKRRGASAVQVALAWMLAQPGVIAIPKAAREDHLRENWAAASLVLDDADRSEIDSRFPPPAGKAPLAMT